MGTLVNYATDKGVALLTLTDPPDNAYTHETIKELDACILEARFDDDIHVVVLTGQGDKYFSAGASANMLKEADESFQYYFFLHAGETFLRFENTPKLVIAAINGHCLGGGLELALSCDLRVAREGAFQIGVPDIELGLSPGAGGTQRLARLVGKARAIELLVEAKRLSVDEALAAGIVHKVWETETSESFVRRAVDYAHEFCPPGRAAIAVGQIKRAVQSGAESSLEQGLAIERELQQRVFGTHDVREGLAAFIHKRKPTFQAR
jgi:enoyl-CoA hydratase/carnithine racemase